MSIGTNVLSIVISFDILIIDPLGQPNVMASRDNCFRTCCPSVRPHFSNLEKQNNRKVMFATGMVMGLTEWIIDDNCLVDSCIANLA